MAKKATAATAATAAKTKASDTKASTASKVPPLLRYSNDSQTGLLLRVHVKPDAQQSQITSVDDEAVSVQIAAPPRDGEANKEVARFVAELFGLRKTDVAVVSGLKSREKVVQMDEMPDVAALTGGSASGTKSGGKKKQSKGDEEDENKNGDVILQRLVEYLKKQAD